MPENIQTIFQEFIQKSTPIFKNRDALNSHFTPETIPHRNQQINTIASILAPSLKGAKPSNIFIYGMTGTGKTLVSRYVGQELEKMSNQGTNQVKVLYINCKMRKIADTEYRLVAELCRLLGQEVPSTGLPTEQVYSTFFRVLDSYNWVVIIILDEIDTLVQKMSDNFLYNFTRINQELKKAKVSVVGITNDLNFIDILDPRVKSSLSEEEILFPPYNALELQDILRQRSDLGFMKSILTESVIPKCAALAAQEHGDARRALDLLRVAGELAERNKENIVKEEHVDFALEKIDYDRIIESVKSIPKQTKIVLYSVIKLVEENKENLQTGEIFNVYEDRCKDLGLTPLTQRRVSDLISELDMLGIINADVVSLGRYGRTRQIRLSVSNDIKEKIKKVLESNLVI
ncbi:MAG: cell division control protein Cdc6 [Candidatus Aenigmarchaeota archaeon CG_4_10_14_0_8_um_filter_37_24]|nr:ORC1-type DNA replication protein [Candidatus Aenigmarchaeota archaeon]PIV68261.1 MAG: cell division control protein Cdc6 [Candidatus Aenigmarchaeota archaeon CG01_land_8_20_14_3_00_37_9]PIW41234.1 MAG: cell division control protein Cdc6 [Candidatus Aenigmarchaeota archaeon CG15_BIG_FIL_POST_REV_8_21_14_020_37_27]PIX50253.1 MAG: cell division control protein Cdc6 [Candidatus Aenigmarchaeota archaeon CG_4_8_14_3_um_filter_37_24]PIY35010.1 MAG: cell division control protein Cdc6 [Candidatus Ae